MDFSSYSSKDTKEIKQLFTRDIFRFKKGASESLLIKGLAFDLITDTCENDLYSFVAIEHKKRIGQKLIHFGLNTLKKDNAKLVFTYGDPNFYSKIGFYFIKEKFIQAPLTFAYPKKWLI